MSIILFIVVVLIVTCLLLYAVQLIPLPVEPPPLQYVKALLMVLIVLFAAFLILQKAGVAF